MSGEHLSPESAVAYAYGLEDSSEGHVAGCPSCAGRVERLREDRDMIAEAFHSAEPVAAATRRRPWLAGIAAALCVGLIVYLLFFDRPSVPAPVSPAASQDVAAWIEELAGDDLETRDRATNRLRELGERAEAALREALKNPRNPEQRDRVEFLLKRIELGRRRDLATAGKDGRILLWSADGQEGSKFHGVLGAPARFLSWSPDGRRIAYARVVNPLRGEWALFARDFATEEVETGIAEGRWKVAYWNPPGVWSPDSLRICSSSGKLLLTDFKTGESQELAAGGLPVFWSAEGLYYHTGTALCRWRVSSGKSEEVLRTPRFPAITGDGAFVFYWGPADGRRSYATETYPLLRRDLRTGMTLPLLEGVAAEPGSTLSASRDGKRVVFVRGGEACVLEVDGCKERRLGQGTAPALSPDGSRVAFEQSDGETCVVHLETGEEIRVQGGAPAWSPIPSSK